MSAEINIAGIQIPQSDWDATPESVKAVVTVLSERLAYIEEQLNSLFPEFISSPPIVTS